MHILHISKNNFFGQLHNNLTRFQKSKASLYGKNHENITENPRGIIMLPVTDISVHRWCWCCVLAFKSFIIVFLRFLVEIFIHIILQSVQKCINSLLQYPSNLFCNFILNNNERNVPNTLLKHST